MVSPVEAASTARIAMRLVRDRVRLARRMERESLRVILDDIEGSAGREAPRALDRSFLFALRAGESLVARSHIAPSTCLYRALARYALFRRHGHRAAFVMGLRSDADGGEGHAWVEVDGVPFGETIAPELVVTLRHPS